MKTYEFTRREEVANVLTHAIGAILSIVGLISLVIAAESNRTLWQTIPVTIFGTTMLFMYLSSTIVHSLPKGKWKDIFQIIDHASIYLFIAGTYTPLLLILLRNEKGLVMFQIIWGIAFIGIIFKIFFVKRFLVLSTLFYILMGWLIMFVWDPLTGIMPENGILLLIAGGLLYTIGTIFYMWRCFPYHHAVWHLFVIAGSTFHFFSIFYYVI